MKMSKLNFELKANGTVYICNDGTEVTLTLRNEGATYPFSGSNGSSYNRHGRVWYGARSEKDIYWVKLTLPIENGKKYVRRDGLVVVATPNTPTHISSYTLDGDRHYVFRENGLANTEYHSASDLVEDFVEPASEVIKLSDNKKFVGYKTIIDIASAIQAAGGSVDVLRDISLHEFLSICEANKIEISVRVKK